MSAQDLTADPGRSIIIGTAGHIDHGKTALIRALTGIDTDRLPEEKRRGITIDLGFASMQTRSTGGAELRFSFIDVPGHARFVRNMLAGTGGIDAVLMVVSAEEGVKPQTREHLAICGLLGIEHGITVLTKIDAVSEERQKETTASVRAFLKDSFLSKSPLIDVSAHSGAGIAQLWSELIRMAARLPIRSRDTLLRLPIDRAFVMKGFGTVVTGTLIGGSAAVGDEVAIEPGGLSTRVRGLQVHGRTEERANAGSRVALNLARIETADVERGKMLVAPGTLRAVDCVDVMLSVLEDASPLKHRSRVHFHAFASECIAAATLYEAAAVQPGGTAFARLRLAHPVVLAPGDRFVLRQGSPVTTIGGGRVLDSYPLPQQRKAKTMEWLMLLNGVSGDERVWLRIDRSGVAGISLKQLSIETGLEPVALKRCIDEWVRDGRLRSTSGERMLTSAALEAASALILRGLSARSASVTRAELKERTSLEQDVFDLALKSLEQERKALVAGEMVALPCAHAPNQKEEGLLSAIRSEFERAGIAPPSPQRLGVGLGITPDAMRRLITQLLREKTLVRLGDDSLCFDRRALEALANRVRALRGQQLDVAAFKKLAGVTRKYAIPLLEYFDRERITVKQGDRRLVL